MSRHAKSYLILSAILLLTMTLACQLPNPWATPVPSKRSADSIATPALDAESPAARPLNATPGRDGASNADAVDNQTDDNNPASGDEVDEKTAAIQTLYEKAKAEGEVVIWGPTDTDLEWIPRAFGARFPGIEVNWRADLDAPTKIIAESRAGRRSVDVFAWSLGGTLPLQERQLLANNDWAIWDVLPDNVMMNGSSAAIHNLVNVLLYNTELVAAEDAPKTWDDLLAEKYRGQIAANDLGLSRAIAFLAVRWGEADALKYAQDLRDKSEIMITRVPLDLIIQEGERAYGLGAYLDSVELHKEKGRPLDWAILSPTGAVQFVVSPLDRSPHPNAARLLAGWLASDEGKSLREQYNHSADMRPGTSSKLAKQLEERGIDLIHEDVENIKPRADVFERLTRIFATQDR